MLVLTALFAALFAAIHLFAGRLRFLEAIPRSRFLSAAGGAAVAYVFLHVLPELAAQMEHFVDAFAVAALAAELRVYLVALLGLVTFYGLERAARSSRSRSRREKGKDVVEREIFWLHIGSFAIYNALIGYLLLHREDDSLWSLVTYFIAMGLHFVTNDFGLRQDHKARYQRVGRWILAAAVIVGWALGALVAVPPLALALLFAFLAGGVILNVLKEELPEERESRFWPFVAGAGGYGALLVAAA